MKLNIEKTFVFQPMIMKNLTKKEKDFIVQQHNNYD